MFRGEDGKAYVLDAYCPHLGANLAVGGQVVGNCIECPFHGWRFNGNDGKCVKIPYAEKGRNRTEKSLTHSPSEKHETWFISNSSLYVLTEETVNQLQVSFVLQCLLLRRCAAGPAVRSTAPSWFGFTVTARSLSGLSQRSKRSQGENGSTGVEPSTSSTLTYR